MFEDLEEENSIYQRKCEKLTDELLECKTIMERQQELLQVSKLSNLLMKKPHATLTCLLYYNCQCIRITLSMNLLVYSKYNINLIE